MSEVRSALPGAVYEGAARVAEAGPRGMVTIRGDLAAAALKNAATGIAGVDIPGPGQANVAGERGLAWMSPDEFLLLVPHGEADAAVDTLSRALEGTHHLAANVSDARARFTLSGPAAREVLAKLTPSDLDPAGFGPGQFRRTRLAQVAAAFWMTDADTFEIMCFRSQAAYVFEILKLGARPGAEVGYF